MMNKKYIFAAMATLLLVGCNKVDNIADDAMVTEYNVTTTTEETDEQKTTTTTTTTTNATTITTKKTTAPETTTEIINMTDNTISETESYNNKYMYVESNIMIDTNDRRYLAEIVMHEAGSDSIVLYNKAYIVAAVMNRVNDSRFPDSIYEVLTQPGQFSGFAIGACNPTQSCYDAVDYYFNHVDDFGNENSWYGDGINNYFYIQ